jgi:hypothetical protein
MPNERTPAGREVSKENEKQKWNSARAVNARAATNAGAQREFKRDEGGALPSAIRATIFFRAFRRYALLMIVIAEMFAHVRAFR